MHIIKLIMIEYLTIFRALEPFKSINDRVTIHTGLNGLKSIILSYIWCYL